MKKAFYNHIENLQNNITSALESIDGNAKFKEDLWSRKAGGGGRTRILQNGDVFAKGGVNISKVYGALPKAMESYFKVKEVDFFACGLRAESFLGEPHSEESMSDFRRPAFLFDRAPPPAPLPSIGG